MGVMAQSALGIRLFSWDDVLAPYVYVFYGAYVVAFLFTPIMRLIARQYGIIDEPDGIRKMHSKPVAYLGGVAVFLGWLAGLAVSQFLNMHQISEPMRKAASITLDPTAPKVLVVNFGIVISACIIVLLGLWDDVLRLNPWMKILGQVAAAACLLLSDVGVRASLIFIEPILMRTSVYLHWPVADPQTLDEFLRIHFWIIRAASWVFVVGLVVLCCNATNLMDGLDGLCGGVTAITAGGFLFLGVSVATEQTAVGLINLNQDALRVVLGLALLGAVLGFVPSNFNPASIFLGDTGSMFVGFACATMAILFASAGKFKWFLASMVMLSLPLLDTALAFVRRWTNHRPIFSADRYHFHHQLVARGFSVKQTVLISYGLSLAFCLLGSAIVFIRTRYAVAVYLVVFGSIIVAAYKMGMVHERVARESPDAQPETAPQAPAAAAAIAEQQPVGVPSGSDALAPDSWAETAQPGRRPERVA